MASIRISRGKAERLDACATAGGIIAALAVDHRTPLLNAIAAARGPSGTASADDMLAFKSAVTHELSRHASAMLLDPEYSLAAIGLRAPGAGVLLAYERTGYDSRVPGRLPDLLPEWSVRRLAERGAQGIKILLYYNPFDAPRINAVKHAYVERIGAECATLQVPFYLEPIVYDDQLPDAVGPEFARRKPAYVEGAIAEFSDSRYGVDVLKVEVPVLMRYVAGTRAHDGPVVYTRAEALEHFRAVAAAAGRPLIYLSAGVSDAVFCEALELAAEAGAPYSGVLVGRATWQGGVAAYARGGVPALEDWLRDEGARNIQAIAAAVALGARPWWAGYGSREQIELV